MKNFEVRFYFTDLNPIDVSNHISYMVQAEFSILAIVKAYQEFQKEIPLEISYEDAANSICKVIVREV